jgi:hypothetical protein
MSPKSVLGISVVGFSIIYKLSGWHILFVLHNPLTDNSIYCIEIDAEI